MENTDTEQCFAQVFCNTFHPNMVLKKAEVEIYPCPEVSMAPSVPVVTEFIHSVNYCGISSTEWYPE